MNCNSDAFKCAHVSNRQYCVLLGAVSIHYCDYFDFICLLYIYISVDDDEMKVKIRMWVT